MEGWGRAGTQAAAHIAAAAAAAAGDAAAGVADNVWLKRGEQICGGSQQRHCCHALSWHLLHRV
eukprot:501139-Pelagomonas_calceolata.AAC.5